MAKTTSSTRARESTDQPPAADENPAAAVDVEGPPPAASADDAPEQPEPDTPSAAAGSDDISAPAELPPGVYEYVHGIGCVYPHVPLTCHAHHPAVAATDQTPEVPEQEATVFDWPDGPPPDGRWAATDKKPNQAADNAGGRLNSKE
ncbi:hypothetical protein ACFUEN_28815 [Streptomyces griseorubiginosus]|uniref:hypothetical protein n=1 Tax=Streptomyces griseorubiginosus TaxID=67304 RepID=UPI003625C0A1